MANDDNLQNLRDLTTSQRRERAIIAGKASAAAKRKKKALRETFEIFLTMPISSGRAANLETVKNLGAMKGENITVQEAIVLAQLKKAMKGDTKSAEFIRDTIGQKPDSKMNIDLNIPVLFEGEGEIEE